MQTSHTKSIERPLLTLVSGSFVRIPPLAPVRADSQSVLSPTPKPSVAASAPTGPVESAPTLPAEPAKAPATGAPAQTAAPPTSEPARHKPLDGFVVVALLLGGLLLLVDCQG